MFNRYNKDFNVRTLIHYNFDNTYNAVIIFKLSQIFIPYLLNHLGGYLVIGSNMSLHCNWLYT